MIRNFSGIHTFTHPDTGEAFPVRYHGYYRYPRHEYMGHTSVTLQDIPEEIKDFEQLIIKDIVDYESK